MRNQISYSEFLEWLEFLALQESEHHKDEYYLAQIATEVRRSYVEHPRKIKIEDFLINRAKTSDPKEASKNSKKAWMSLLKPPV